ncbi:MAG TPA: hypothetical protein VMU54_21970 [Planctomycetota bacterium]|nr:hypothetical protein [Planctomycetota bacterium]
MTLSIVFAATILLAAAGAWRWRAAGSGSPGEQILRLGFSLPAVFCLLLFCAYSVAYAQSDSWSFIRLAPAIAQSWGTSLYHQDGKGPLLGWSYGPVMPLLNLPLGVFTDPSVALAASSLMGLAVLLLPLLLSIWRSMPPTPEHRVIGILILAAVQAILMHCDVSLYWLRRIQVDVYAMGLCQLGFVVLLKANPNQLLTNRERWMSAAFFVASAFSKHNEVVLAAIPIGYVWLRDGRLPALRMTFALAVLGLAGFLLCIACWGWEAVFLNLWLVPARHPWAAPGILGLTIAAERFLDLVRTGLVVFLAMAACDPWLGARSRNFREWVAERPWVLPAAAALVIFPVSLVGRIKIGGDENSFHSVYFMAVAAGMIAARWTTQSAPAALRRFVPGLACIVAVVGSLLYDPGTQSLDAQFRDSQLRREYRFAREHPGQVWFGADPLVTLYTDGKAYHQGYGVYDRTLPNLPPTPRQLREHLPSGLRWVSTPLSPFWRPEGLVPIRPPAGINKDSWFEVQSGG